MKYLIKTAARLILHKEIKQAADRQHEVRGLVLALNRQMLTAPLTPEVKRITNRLKAVFAITDEELLDV